MENRYARHFLMTVEDAKEYAVDAVRYFEPSARLFGCEIGDGNINYVFKIWDKAGRSLVIKQADTRLRSSGRPLDLCRNRIEAEALKIEGDLAPGFVPKVYHYSETMSALSMEDISGYKNLRSELMDGKTFSQFSDWISSFLADTLLPTTDLVVNRAEKKERVRMFTNIELCDITEDLVFTEPYDNYKNRNIITPGIESFVDHALYADEKLKGEVGLLRNAFLNHAQALLHGDLHTGSVFINEQGIKVIDPEFAFYGPMGYDVGNVMGNLFFAWAYKAYMEPSNTAFAAWIEGTIAGTFDLFAQKFSRKFDELVTLPLYNLYFKERYLAGVLADSIGCAGTEIIRRVVGDTKVPELAGIKDLSIRVPMERSLIRLGIRLIKERREISSGKQITEIYNKFIS